MMKTYIYRMSYVSPAVCLMSGLYRFSCTSDFGCAFCLPDIFFGTIMILCTRWGAFCFSWKALEYKSNGKFDEWKGEIL